MWDFVPEQVRRAAADLASWAASMLAEAGRLAGVELPEAVVREAPVAGLAALAGLILWQIHRRRSRAATSEPGQPSRPAEKLELATVLKSSRRVFLGIGLITAMLNVLYLTGSFFMLQVYDRVVPSRSIPTLIGLCVLALVLYTFQACLDVLRGRILVRMGRWLDDVLSGRVFDIITRAPLKTRSPGDGLQPLRDLDQVRSFMSGLGPTALFDLPWMPFYLVICYMFHPLIGLVALIGCLILVALTVTTHLLTRPRAKEATSQVAARNAIAEAGRRNAEVLQALGMRERMADLWNSANGRYMESQQRTADIAGGFGSVSKVLRMMLQSGVLAIGGYLVVHQEASGGVIIAAAILTSRALAPVELSIAHWKGFVGARQGWKRLQQLSDLFPVQEPRTQLPPPRETLAVENVWVSPPADQRLVVQDASLSLTAGHGLGIVGPSASGKSSLVRAIVGVWAPAKGTVRLDGAALDQWPGDALGRHVGYLPQDVELFAGTVAQNVARFEREPDPEALISAAQAAGVHELILRLPSGYETQIGEGGASLSAGQRQRIGLARALYRDPFLVVLDEPNSNLDAEGDRALTQAILGIRARGGIVIVVAHRTSAVAGVDQLLVMADGRVQMLGPKDQVMSKLSQPQAPPVPLKVVEGANG